jgi:hypothetical protein
MTRDDTICTTLNQIREHEPCADSWRKLLKGLGKAEADDKPLPFSRIVEICGIDDALWAMRSCPEYDREWRLFAVWCARQVQHLMSDPRSIAALDVAERFVNGNASRNELNAAEGAAAACDSARDTAWPVAAACDFARDAAWSVARGSAWAAARGAAYSAAWAAAGSAAGSARTAAEGSARDAQRKKFLEIVK